MTESFSATPLEQPAGTLQSRRSMTIGLPACADPSERRFPLTPEGCAMLIERGFRIKMQEGAPASINYTDSRYTRIGVEIVSDREAWACDIVVYLAIPAPAQVRRMRRGTMLLTLENPQRHTRDTVTELLRRHIITIALDLVRDTHGCTPFADILAEIDGRAAVAMASSMLADPARGKGILLGGVAGIVPCEVLIVGSGIAAASAARSAVGLGAMVRMFDNDVYSLRRTAQELGPSLITSTIHPHTLGNALHSADVVILTRTGEPFAFTRGEVNSMKRGVLAFDLSAEADGSAFPSMRVVDLALAPDQAPASDTDTRRVCCLHAGSAVARTAAMALSDTLITLMGSIVSCEGPGNALRLLPGMQQATLTFFGKVVNKRLGTLMGMRYVDISIYLTLS